MELDQWIAVFTAVSQTADSRERSLWNLFAGGIVAASLLIAATAYTVLSSAGRTDLLGLGTASLGLLLCLTWILAQYRKSAECAHWRRLLCSIESQFAGAEFHRSLQRLWEGEQICVRSSRWICGEWQAEGVSVPTLLRQLPVWLTKLAPLGFGVGFLVLLVLLAIGA